MAHKFENEQLVVPRGNQYPGRRSYRKGKARYIMFICSLLRKIESYVLSRAMPLTALSTILSAYCPPHAWLLLCSLRPLRASLRGAEAHPHLGRDGSGSLRLHLHPFPVGAGWPSSPGDGQG